MVVCGGQVVFFQFVVFLLTVVNSAKFIQGNGMKLELIHRHDLEFKWHNGANPNPGPLQRLRQLLHSDTIRTVRIRRRIPKLYHPDCTNGSRSRNGHGHNVSGEMPIHSGADAGTGQYFVHFRVGSPAQRLVLIADTGSDLTWMNCRYRCTRGRCRRSRSRDMNKRRVFLADHSSSFRTLPCSSTMCKLDLANLFSLASCPSPMDPCAYDYRYSDGSATVGLFANETVTFQLTKRKKIRLRNVLVGCSESARGQSFRAVDGVMGLAYSNHSFAVKAAERFGGKFSYCLVDHLSPKNVSSYLIFGSHQDSGIPLGRMRYTELILGAISPFYAVNLRGISVGGSMLDIPTDTWNASGVGGVIIDSGSSLTSLAQPAYQPVMSALRLSLLNFRNLNLDIGPLEYCFNSTGFNESTVPRLVFHFMDGARFEPQVKSYVIDAAPGVKCLGLVPGTWPGSSVIGNIMQQNHFWEFDLVNHRLGFAASSCSA